MHMRRNTACFALFAFSAFHLEFVMNALQRAVPTPQIEIVERVLRGGRSFGIARH